MKTGIRFPTCCAHKKHFQSLLVAMLFNKHLLLPSQTFFSSCSRYIRHKLNTPNSPESGHTSGISNLLPTHHSFWYQQGRAPACSLPCPCTSTQATPFPRQALHPAIQGPPSHTITNCSGLNCVSPKNSCVNILTSLM